MAACQDVIAPDQVAKVPELRLSSQATADQLATLGANLDDMTSWSLAALPDGDGKANIVTVLGSLKQHLTSGSIAACQQDVKDARGFLTALNDVQEVDLGAVGLALDVVQQAIDSTTN